MTESTIIWNRACGYGEPGTGDGDIALRHLISFHGLVQNGGVLHALEVIDSTGTLDDSLKGYVWMGWGAAAGLITEVKDRAEQIDPDDDPAFEALEWESNNRYDELAPDDGYSGL